MNDNRQYWKMLGAAVMRMRHIDLIAAAARSGLSADPEAGRVTVESFGEKTAIDCKTLMADPPIEMWQHLLLAPLPISTQPVVRG